MEMISFTKEQRSELTEQLQAYFRDELDQELGTFEAEFLLQFIAKEIGPYFYNQGLYDAQAMVSKSIESVVESVYTIEKPTRFSR
jgi:uncharacterized protein (DUF2164 family)